MKRFTALHFTALATLWLGHATTCAALDKANPTMEKCLNLVQKNLAADREMGTVGAVIRDENEAWNDSVIRVDSALIDLLSPSVILLQDAAENKRKPRVSNAQSRSAGRILYKYGIPLGAPLPLTDVGTWNDSADDIQYKCITEVCGEGNTCTTVYPRKVGQRLVNFLGLYHKFFNETMSWAKNVNRIRKKVPTFERGYDRAEKRLRSAVPELPERLHVIDIFAPRK
jgi:hypothetical protein